MVTYGVIVVTKAVNSAPRVKMRNACHVKIEGGHDHTVTKYVMTIVRFATRVKVAQSVNLVTTDS